MAVSEVRRFIPIGTGLVVAVSEVRRFIPIGTGLVAAVSEVRRFIPIGTGLVVAVSEVRRFRPFKFQVTGGAASQLTSKKTFTQNSEPRTRIHQFSHRTLSQEPGYISFDILWPKPTRSVQSVTHSHTHTHTHTPTHARTHTQTVSRK